MIITDTLRKVYVATFRPYSKISRVHIVGIKLLKTFALNEVCNMQAKTFVKCCNKHEVLLSKLTTG